MLTLLLLRHAKSSWNQPITDDHDRPLADRGEKAAPVMGDYIAKHGLSPDLVLCSSSVRTRATLELVVPQLESEPEISYERELYLAEAEELLARLQKVPARAKRVMMIGHNPGFEDLARLLSGDGPADVRSALQDKFPTAGLAVLTFNAKAWRSAAPGKGTLTTFVTPRSLQKAGT